MGLEAQAPMVAQCFLPEISQEVGLANADQSKPEARKPSILLLAKR
jgi:hypothetical protein